MTTSLPARRRSAAGVQDNVDDAAEHGSLTRQPPHSFDAEQSVLGAMLLSKDAVADVVERLRGEDFYRPNHQSLFEAIVDLYGRGEPADAVTVAAELDRRGVLSRLGGAPYLHTLISMVPTAANACYYADIVAEKALLRRLVGAGTRIVQYGYAGGEGDEVNSVVDRAQAEIYDITARTHCDDTVAVGSLLASTMDELDMLATGGALSRGVPTGFAEIDDVTQGLHPGQMAVIAARPGVGKALALDTVLPTPHGWTTMGQAHVGQWLLDAAGEPTRIVAATEVMIGRPCFAVEFGDGNIITADADHQWPTRRGVITTTVLQVGDCMSQRGRPADTVTAVHAVPSVPVRCVQVDNPQHLYLAGPGRVPTHNSTLALDFLRSCSIRAGMASVIFSLEMSKSEIVMRLLSAEASVKLSDLRSGRLTDEQWARLSRCLAEIGEAPLYIDDSPNLTMAEIRAKARRLTQRHDLKLIVIDYLQLMTSGKRYESRQQEVSDFSRSLKLLAKELQVPVVALSQLNRGPEQRTDKRPQVSDLRESGSIEQDSDMIMLLHRPDLTDPDHPRSGEVEVHLAKHRNGPTRHFNLAAQLACSRFADMPNY